jgi:tetratricopeptide (TPR) repeat protein
MALSIFSAGISHARATVENLSQVEKMFMQGKYDRVISESTKLIDAGAHGREELFYLKGLSQTQLARTKEARQTFEYMVERYPKGKRAFDGYIGIGDAYFLEGKYPEAISGYKNALDSYPDHRNASVAYYKIGCAYHKFGSPDKAKEYFDKAKSRSPLSFESKMILKDLEAPPGPIGAVKSFFRPASSEEPGPAGYFYVQVGYFKNRSNAEKLTEKLKRKGYDSYLSAQIENGATFYRVKVGRFNVKSDAEPTADRLKSDGYKTRICR